MIPPVTTELYPSKPPSVKLRVLARQQLLKQWLEKGVPKGYMPRLPQSLREAREWNDPELGIFSIGSRNEFVTTHSEWGDVVADINTLLDTLHERAGSPPQVKKSATSRNDSLNQKVHELEQLLTAITSQFQTVRDRNERLARDLAKSLNRISELESLNRSLEASRPGGLGSPNNVRPIGRKRK